MLEDLLLLHMSLHDQSAIRRVLAMLTAINTTREYVPIRQDLDAPATHDVRTRTVWVPVFCE